MLTILHFYMSYRYTGLKKTCTWLVVDGGKLCRACWETGQWLIPLSWCASTHNDTHQCIAGGWANCSLKTMGVGFWHIRCWCVLPFCCSRQWSDLTFTARPPLCQQSILGGKKTVSSSVSTSLESKQKAKLDISLSQPCWLLRPLDWIIVSAEVSLENDRCGKARIKS